jgi:citrate lyase subunit beta/citryl-CoA lyase
VKSVRQQIDLEPRYLVQMAHLTVPANRWRYIEKAVTKSAANLVMLDLEDSVPSGDRELLDEARHNVIRAFRDLHWGSKLRFFRPRGLSLDPDYDDMTIVIEHAGRQIDGLVYPKIDNAGEVLEIDETLTALEKKTGLTPGSIRIELLIESVLAEENVFEIASATPRLAGLIFGSYDYWASLGMNAGSYSFDHTLLNSARARIVKAAASVGVPAIAEMTANYPTKDKTEEERKSALEEFRRDALFVRGLGFAGKWTGIPDQAELAVEIFKVSDEEVARAIKESRLYIESERQGRGSTMIAGRMADRATDRIHRRTLKLAWALGRLDEQLARELGII